MYRQLTNQFLRKKIQNTYRKNALLLTSYSFLYLNFVDIY